ncbi:hypothetical protein LCGC14_2678360 [marine sediment metagenome]|uniref:Uncharacterized protein n=1 Tax=marine sediment metagenome TaxID=412755 RepID=A0A0F9CDX9_9ZZZZ
MDKWLYPEDLDNEDLVVNIFWDESEMNHYANFYPLPEDWRERVTQNQGKDGKPSIHDIMEEEE